MRITTLTILTLFLFTNLSNAQFLSGKEYGVGFKLSWPCGQEGQFPSYVIEKSLNGKEYKSIGHISSKIFAGEGISFEYEDTQLGIKEATYRLKLLYPDGKVSLSEPLKLKREDIRTFTVVKKETIEKNVYQLFVSSLNDGEIALQLSSKMGDILSSEKQALSAGLNEFIVDLTNEPKGEYAFLLQVGSEMEISTLFNVVKEENNVARKNNDKE